MNEARTRQIAERIGKIVAELLERRIKDPRLGFVTVTEARLTADLREAKVFYTVFGDAAAPQTEPMRPVVEAAASSATDQPQQPTPGRGPSVHRPDVMSVRPIAHRPKAHCSCAHRYHRATRMAKPAGQARLAALRLAVWRGTPRIAQPIQSWAVVLLGVGY
jgi:hypothetical protein